MGDPNWEHVLGARCYHARVRAAPPDIHCQSSCNNSCKPSTAARFDAGAIGFVHAVVEEEDEKRRIPDGISQEIVSGKLNVITDKYNY